MKDRLATQAKLDKEKAKKQKEADAGRKFMQEKQMERVQQVQQRKKHNDIDLTHKAQEVDEKVKVRLRAAEASRIKQLDEMRNKNMGMTSLSQGEDVDSQIGHSRRM